MAAGGAGFVLSAIAAVLGDLLPGFPGLWASAVGVLAVGSGLLLTGLGLKDKVLSPQEEHAAVLRIKAEMSRRLEGHGAPIDLPVREIPEPERVLTVDLESTSVGQEYTSRTFISRLCEGWATPDAARCTLLLGAAGSGKTRLLYELTRTLADAFVGGSSPQIPIFLRAHGWDPERTSVRRWLTDICSTDYGIPPLTTSRWLRRSTVLLIIDGIDELPAADREAGVDALKTWVRSADGSRVLLASRISEWPLWARWLDPDRVAVLDSMPVSLMEECLRAVLADADLVRENVDLETLVATIRVSDGELSRPALLQLLIDSLSLPHFKDLGDPGDEGRAAFLAGLHSCRAGALDQAKRDFGCALEFPHSPWRSLAAVHLSLLLSEQGDVNAAEELLRKSLSWRLQQSLERDMEQRRSAPMTELELRVFNAMEEAVSYDLGQVSAQSRLPISAARDSLRSLREKGLIESYHDADGYARFRRLLGESVVR